MSKRIHPPEPLPGDEDRILWTRQDGRLLKAACFRCDALVLASEALGAYIIDTATDCKPSRVNEVAGEKEHGILA